MVLVVYRVTENSITDPVAPSIKITGTSFFPPFDHLIPECNVSLLREVNRFLLDRAYSCLKFTIQSKRPPFSDQLPATSFRAGHYINEVKNRSSGNFTLAPFQGAIVSAQYHYSVDNAWRGGVTVNGDVGSGTSLGVSFIADTSSGSSGNSHSSNSVGLGVWIQHIWYANPTGVVHFYVGIGPGISYSRGYSQQESYLISKSSGYWNKETFTMTSTTWGYGVNGLAGVEWFASNWFALHAEYGASISYSVNSLETDLEHTDSSAGTNSGNKASQTNRGWSLSNAAVNLGMSVYF